MVDIDQYIIYNDELIAIAKRIIMQKVIIGITNQFATNTIANIKGAAIRGCSVIVDTVLITLIDSPKNGYRFKIQSVRYPVVSEKTYKTITGAIKGAFKFLLDDFAESESEIRFYINPDLIHELPAKWAIADVPTVEVTTGSIDYYHEFLARDIENLRRVNVAIDRLERDTENLHSSSLEIKGNWIAENNTKIADCEIRKSMYEANIAKWKSYIANQKSPHKTKS